MESTSLSTEATLSLVATSTGGDELRQNIRVGKNTELARDVKM